MFYVIVMPFIVNTSRWRLHADARLFILAIVKTQLQNKYDIIYANVCMNIDPISSFKIDTNIRTNNPY